MPFCLSRKSLKKKVRMAKYISAISETAGDVPLLKRMSHRSDLYFLGADMGGMGSMLSVKEKGDVRIWRVDSPDGQTKTIEINMKDSNKY